MKSILFLLTAVLLATMTTGCIPSCSPVLRTERVIASVARTSNPSTISATGPTTVGAASVVTITLLTDASIPIVGTIPTFSSSNVGDTVGVCSASDGAGVSTCTLDSTVAELKTLTITSPAVAMNKTTTTVFVAAAAASLTVTGFTDPAIAGDAHNITITAYDAFGNVATGYTGTVAITSNSVATLPANYTFVAGDAGVKTRSVTLLTAGANRTITATDTGNGALTATQNNIDVTAAAATKLSFSQQPVGGVDTDTNLATQPIVQVLDAYDNVVTSATNAVTLTASAHATCATTIASAVSATSNPLAAVAGVSTFAAVKVLNVSAVRLKATSGTLTSACSSAFVVTPGAAASLAFTVQPTATSVTTDSDLTTQPTVTAYDANGNVATGFSSAITLTANSNGAGCSVVSDVASGIQATTNPVSATAGVSAFAAVRVLKTNAVRLRASTAGGLQVCSNTFTIGAGSATKLSYSQQPVGGVDTDTNLATQPIVQVLDANDNVVTGATNSITLTASAHATCATTIASAVSATSNPLSATSGVATFAAVKVLNVSAVRLQASATGLTSACSNAFVINPGSPAKLSFSQQPVGGVDTDTNLATQPIVQVLDANNNLVTSATDAVTLEASSSATCATTIASAVSATTNPLAAIAGSASFAAVKVLNVSAVRLKATSGTLTSACSNAFVVTPGTFSDTTSTFTLSAATVATTSTVTGTVTPKDANGNNTTVGFTGEAQITFAHAGGTSTATFSATAAPVSGAYAVTITGGTAGTATTITATINGSALVTTRDLTVTGGAVGPLHHFEVSMNATPTAHAAENITITAQDASNNTVTTDTSTVAFTSTDDDVTLPANLTLAAGTGSTSITLRSVGSVTVTVTSGAITGSQTVNVSATGGGTTEYTVGRFVDSDSRFASKWWNGAFWFSAGKDDGRKLFAHDGAAAVRDTSMFSPNSNRGDDDPGTINFVSSNYALFSAFNQSDGKYYMNWMDWANQTYIPIDNVVATNEVSYNWFTKFAFKGLDANDGYSKLLMIAPPSTTGGGFNTSSCTETSTAGGIGVVDPAPCGGGTPTHSTRNEEPLNVTGSISTTHLYFTSLNFYGNRRLYHYQMNVNVLTDISPIAGSITVAQTQMDSTGRLFYITSDGTSPELYVYTPGVGNLKLTYGWSAINILGTYAYNVDKFSYNETSDFVYYIADRSAGGAGTNKVFRVLSNGTSTSESSNILSGNENALDVLANSNGGAGFILNGGTGVALYSAGTPATIDTTQYFTTASLFDYSSTLRVVQGVINGIVSLWSYNPATSSAISEVPNGFGNAEGYTSMTVYPDPARPTTITARGYKAVNDTTQGVILSGELAAPKDVIDPRGTKGRDKPLYPTYFNGYIYYAGLDATGAYKLFKTDGTTITQISDTRGAGRSDGITAVVATPTNLYFTALAGATQLKLYMVRIIDDTVTQVSDINSGGTDDIQNLTAGTSRVYFTALTGVQRVYYVTNGATSASLAGATTNCSLLTIGSSDSIYYRSTFDQSLHGYKTNGTATTAPAPSGFLVGKAGYVTSSGTYTYFHGIQTSLTRHNADMGNTFDTIYSYTTNQFLGLTHYRGHLYFFERIVGGPPSQYRIVDINFNNTEANLADDIVTTNSTIVFDNPSDPVPVFNGTQTFVYFTAQETNLSWTLFRWDPVGLALTRTAAASHTARPTLLTRVGSSLIFVNNNTADATVTGKISILDNTGTITNAAASLSPSHTDDITWIKNFNGKAYFNGNAAGTIDYTRIYEFQE